MRGAERCNMLWSYSPRILEEELCNSSGADDSLHKKARREVSTTHLREYGEGGPSVWAGRPASVSGWPDWPRLGTSPSKPESKLIISLCRSGS